MHQSTMDVLAYAISQMDNYYRLKIEENDPAAIKADPQILNYKRYIKVLSAGASKVISPAGRDNANDPKSHQVGALRPSQDILWKELEVLDKVCELDPKLDFKNLPLKEKQAVVSKLVDGGQLLILTMSEIDNVISVALDLELDEGFTEPRFYDPYKFSISRPDSGLILEVNQNILDAVQDYASPEKFDHANTGCPLPYARTSDGRNIMIDFYKSGASLYKEFCLPNLDKYSGTK